MKKIIFLILISICTRLAYANDGIKEIKIPDYLPSNIIKSPIGDASIWVTDQNKASYEYNYQTGELTDLSNKFGDFANGLKGLVVEDQFNPDLIWLGNFHKGVLCYSRSSKQYSIYNISDYFSNERISIIKPDTDRVWIGTTKNLYYFKRSSNKIMKSPFDKEVWINNIRKDNGKLIINNIYVYNPNDNSITKTNSIYGYKFSRIVEFRKYDEIYFLDQGNKSIFVGKDIEPYIIHHGIADWAMVVENYLVYYPILKKGGIAVLDLRKRSQKLIKVAGVLNLYNDKDVFWFFDKFGLGRINKSTYKTEKSNISYSIIRCFLTNDEYIWIGIDDGFVQIRKSYLDTILKSVEQTQQNEEMIERKYEELMDEKDPITFANGFYELEKMTTSKKIINRLRYKLEAIFVIRDSSEIKHFEDILAKENDPKINEGICYGLMCGYSLKGDPHKALEYYTKLKTLNNKSLFLEFVNERDVTRMENAKVQLDSLRSSNLPKAERLFRLGKIYFEMFKLSWNYRKVGIDAEFPFRYYKEVLNTYPESEWADNAEYEMLIYHIICSGEGGDTSSNLKHIEELNDFLKKYPETDLVPLVKCNIGSLYYSLMRNNGKGSIHPQDLVYLSKADSIMKQVPDSYTGYEHLDYLRNEIEEFLSKYRWEFEMKLDSTAFSKGESINISFSLENHNDAPKQISLKAEKGIPNFGVIIRKKKYGDSKDYRKTVPFVEDREIRNIVEREYLVDVGENYSEDWDITREIQVDQNKAIGHFELPENCYYSITGYFVLEPHTILFTNPIIIEIK